MSRVPLPYSLGGTLYYAALETFVDLFLVILKSISGIALKENTVQWNRKIIADANGLLSAMEKWSFLVALVIGYNVLDCIKGLKVMFRRSHSISP